MKVYDVLPYGLENAIQTKDLVQVLGLQNDREELRRFTRKLQSRARNTAKAAESAQRALDAASGQDVIGGWYDG